MEKVIFLWQKETGVLFLSYQMTVFAKYDSVTSNTTSTELHLYIAFNSVLLDDGAKVLSVFNVNKTHSFVQFQSFLSWSNNVFVKILSLCFCWRINNEVRSFITHLKQFENRYLNCLPAEREQKKSYSICLCHIVGRFCWIDKKYFAGMIRKKKEMLLPRQQQQQIKRFALTSKSLSIEFSPPLSINIAHLNFNLCTLTISCSRKNRRNSLQSVFWIVYSVKVCRFQWKISHETIKHNHKYQTATKFCDDWNLKFYLLLKPVPFTQFKLIFHPKPSFDIIKIYDDWLQFGVMFHSIAILRITVEWMPSCD